MYLSDDAVNTLNAWFKGRDCRKEYLIYGQGRNRMCYSAARAMFEKYITKAGLTHKGYTLHSFRHTFASELLNADSDLSTIQDLLGHNSIRTTQRCCRVSNLKVQRDYYKAMEVIMQQTAGNPNNP